MKKMEITLLGNGSADVRLEGIGGQELYEAYVVLTAHFMKCLADPNQMHMVACTAVIDASNLLKNQETSAMTM